MSHTALWVKMRAVEAIHLYASSAVRLCCQDAPSLLTVTAELFLSKGGNPAKVGTAVGLEFPVSDVRESVALLPI